MADREPIRVPITLGQLLAAVLVLVLALVLSATALVAFYLNPIFNRQEHGADRQVETSARADCRAAINAPITEVTRKTQIQSAKTTQLLNAALLNAQAGTRSTPEQVAEFVTENNKLTDDLKRAAALPDDPNVIVEHGGVIDGERFKPCPRVG